MKGAAPKQGSMSMAPPSSSSSSSKAPTTAAGEPSSASSASRESGAYRASTLVMATAPWWAWA
eukprot:CAMPEP_0195130400 /NCGR_PEP_ID=MMETSP0448-20130528/143192_1 /TAXON_ID=66468 /ORGANISM="Heterocapsa triquestra, Strain CCMP 448" /LENGTH=62 /DNA_ID=CAMNT_0040168309 /DNA_START=31 /DNA_END=215 /DNA_ORIENTATION=-